MRRKPTSQGGSNYGNQRNNKPRYQQGGSGGGEHRSQNSGGHHNGNRPRKNYPQAREKYLAQARDALASGDRVLAESYFQHADHCYRMMMEEAASRPQRAPFPRDQQNADGTPAAAGEQGAEEQAGENGNGENGGDHGVRDNIQGNPGQLPAFLTSNYEGGEPPAEPVIVQNWEE